MGIAYSVYSKLFPNENNENPKEKKTSNVQISQEDLTMARLKSLRDDIFEKKKCLYKTIEKIDSEIKFDLINKKKEKAKFALQRKQLYEKYCKTIEDKYLFIQNAILEVEKALTDRNLNSVLGETNKLLKDIQNSINLDVFEESIENLQEYNLKKQEFDKLFDQYNINDENKIDEEYEKYEEEIYKKNNSNLIMEEKKNNLNLIKEEKNIFIEEKITKEVKIEKKEEQWEMMN